MNNDRLTSFQLGDLCFIVLTTNTHFSERSNWWIIWKTSEDVRIFSSPGTISRDEIRRCQFWTTHNAVSIRQLVDRFESALIGRWKCRFSVDSASINKDRCLLLPSSCSLVIDDRCNSHSLSPEGRIIVMLDVFVRRSIVAVALVDRQIGLFSRRLRVDFVSIAWQHRANNSLSRFSRLTAVLHPV